MVKAALSVISLSSPFAGRLQEEGAARTHLTRTHRAHRRHAGLDTARAHGTKHAHTQQMSHPFALTVLNNVLASPLGLLLSSFGETHEPLFPPLISCPAR